MIYFQFLNQCEIPVTETELYEYVRHTIVDKGSIVHQLKVETAASVENILYQAVKQLEPAEVRIQ